MSTVIVAPLLSANDEHLTVVEWLKGKGTFVHRGEAIAVVEGSKTTSEVYAEEDGFLVPLKDAGASVNVGEPLAAIVPRQDESVDELLARFREPVPPSRAKESVSGGTRRWTKKAELLAQRHGIDIEQVPAVGVIQEADVLNFLQERHSGRPERPLRDLVDDVYPGNRPQRLVILGAGRGCVQVLDVVYRTRGLRAVAILDSDPRQVGKSIMGCPITGGIDDLDRLWRESSFDAAVISFTNDLKARASLYEECCRKGIPFCNVIDPSVVIHSNVTLGTGNVIMANCRIGACTQVGNNNFLSAFVNIEHHNMLGSSCTFGPGVFTSSRVRVGDRVKFGTGIFIEPGVSVGSDSVVASGAILTKDVPPGHIVKTRVNYFVQRLNT